MTYIEFFDKNDAENICASLANPPERVVLVGDNGKMMERSAQHYRAVFADRGHQVEFVCRKVNKNNMQSILDTLSGLVETYPDCVFDLTGGEDLYLVAVGRIMERYRDRNLQMHRFNIHNGTIIDCDQDGQTILTHEGFWMSVRENIRIYGGDVVMDTVKENGTHAWDMNESFQEEIWAMWEICRANVRRWNQQINVFAMAQDLTPETAGPLTVWVEVPRLTAALRRQGRKLVFCRDIADSLYERGLLTAYTYDGTQLSMTFPNEQVKRCLTKAGQVLEMLIYMAAQNAREPSGEAVYQDVMSGVSIDWDGLVHMTQEEGYDTENEVDVLMMHGVVPVFVSCKNGEVKIDELYKLNTVAERFGGKYAKKVLVATALESADSFDEYFRQRAKDMKIRVAEGVQAMDLQELQRVVRSFWKN